MAGISTAVGIVDRITAPLMRIGGALDSVIGKLHSADIATDKGFGPGKINEATRAVEQVNMEMQATEQQLTNIRIAQDNLNRSIGSQVEGNRKAQDQFNRSIQQGNEGYGSMLGKLKGIGAAYLGFQGLQKTVGLSDSMTQTSARLNMIVDDGGSVEDLEERIFQSAQRSRSSYLETADIVAKLSMNAKDAFSGNDETIRFAETLNKAFVVAGTDAQGVASAMYNLTQALSTGVLRGQDLNAVMSNAPNIVQEIADYMGQPISKIRDLASEGKITADIVKNAMLAAGDRIDKKFTSMPMTWGQVWTGIVDRVIWAMRPLLEIIGVLARNWEALEPIVVSVAGAVAFYTVVLWVNAGAHLKAAAAAKAFFAALVANPLFWLAVVIGVVIYAIYRWIQAVGGLKVAWKITMDAILRVWEATVIAVHNGIVWMLNGLDLMTLGYERAKLGVVNAVQNMKVKTLLILEDMINSAIAKINNFISLLNYLPGVNISAVGQVTFGTMAKLSNKVQEELRNQKMAATEKDINNKINAREVALRALKTDTRLAQQARQAEIKALQSKATGAAVGQGVHDTIAGMAGNVEDIAGSAGAIKDSVAVSTEELKYLRDLAEQEVVNRFTTAEIKIDMINHNNIGSDLDIDGIISDLTVGVTEAMERAAEGVHV